MKINYLLVAALSLSCSYSFSVSASDTSVKSHKVKNMEGILKNSQSYKLGDIDGDGVDEIVFLDVDNKIKAMKVAPVMNELIFNKLALTRWKLVDQRYGERYTLSFNYDGKEVSLGMTTESLSLRINHHDNSLSGGGGNASFIAIEGFSSGKIWGQLVDTTYDGLGADAKPFEAVIKRK